MSGLELQKIPLRQVQDVRQLLMNENARNQLAAVAAKHMNPERMMRVVANAIRTTPKLGQCEPMSFLGALMHCASLGLEPNTPLGHAYLIPFENKRKNVTEVQVVIGYKGLIELARRTGQIASIHGDVVYSDDELFSHEYGSNQHLRHKPGPRKGKIVAFYCYVELDLGNGLTAKGHRVMSYDEVIAHRNQHSQGWKTAVKFGKQADSPWFEGSPTFEAMGIKTVIRRMAGRGELPMSIEFMDAEQTDERQADYRAFAMDPTQGVIPDDDDGQTIDGEVGEPEQKDEAEKPKTDTKPEPEKKAEPAKKPAEPEAKTQAKAPESKAETDTPASSQDASADQAVNDLFSGRDDEQAETTTQEADAALLDTPIAQAILRDATDFGASAARDRHAVQLAHFQENDKALFSAIDAELEKIGG